MHHQTQNTDDKESIKEKKLINIIPKESDAFKNIRLDSQTQRYTSNGPDDLTYEWEQSIGAWLPIISQDGFNNQQSIYSGKGIDEHEPVLHITQKRKLHIKENPKLPKVKVKKNTAVYVTGLPLTTTRQDILSVFEKYGVIQEDLQTGESKIKLYEKEGVFKGDALVVYFKEESVRLAVQMLDDSLFLDQQRITVQPAVFEDKSGDKHVYSKSIIKSKLKHMSKKLDWDEGENLKKMAKLKRQVILHNMFTPKDLLDEPTLLLELKEDVREECQQFGPVTNVVLYPSSKGVILIAFKEPLAAIECVKRMHGRYFGGIQVEANINDGKEEFGSIEVEGGDDSEEKRMQAYHEWMET